MQEAMPHNANSCHRANKVQVGYRPRCTPRFYKQAPMRSSDEIRERILAPTTPIEGGLGQICWEAQS